MSMSAPIVFNCMHSSAGCKSPTIDLVIYLIVVSTNGPIWKCDLLTCV